LPEVLGLAHLAPACQGPVTTRIRLQSGRQEVIALARLRDRPPLLARAWIEVGSDGCSTEAEVEAGYVPPPPQPRLRLPEPAAKGALIPVRSMIAHYMETGLRHDRHGTPIPRRIIHRVEGFYEDRLLLSATLQPAVAANAYLGFNLRAEAGGELELVWHEDGGAVYRLRQRLTVA
jgi:sulfur-oxidizing protein SoxZ